MKKGRFGKWFSQRPLCKFHALGNCIKGRDCPYFHSSFKHKSILLQLDEANAAEAEAKAASKATRNRKKKSE